MKTCELCGTIHSGTYGSGRFCSAKCARSYSTHENRKEINRKVSMKLMGRSVADGTISPKSADAIAKQSHSLKVSLYNKHKDDLVSTYLGNKLDITKEYLDNYRKLHITCEICGKVETKSNHKNQNKPNNLCVDHNHSTNKFRGLLCRNCNSRLGWYENNKEIIDNYLQRGLG